MEQSKTTLALQNGPGLWQLRWVWLLTQLNYLPKVTVTTVPDENGRILRISYRVFYISWEGGKDLFAFFGFPVAAYIIQGKCLAKARRGVACDSIVCNPSTGQGQIQFHSSNPIY